jgi:2-polyprenyl-3-methyl-5-hydroxy-6-metoxy-1,4-benzoquinol methylase
MVKEDVEKLDWENVWKRKNATYHELLQQVESLKITALIQKYFTATDRVLEAGCGDGKFVFYFNSRGYNFTGIDYVDSVIQKNKEFATEAGLKEDTFQVADVKDLNKYREQFDVYLSMGVIEHFKKKDQQSIIKNARLCLKKGGKVVIAVPNLYSPWTITRYLTMIRYPNKCYQKNISRFKIKKMFEKEGFKTIDVFNGDVRSAFRMALHLDNKKILGCPNLFYHIKGSIYKLAGLLEKLIPIIGYNTYYIGQKIG